MSEASDREIHSIPDVLAYFGIGTVRKIAAAGFGLSNHNYLVSADGTDYVVKFLVNQAPDTLKNDIEIQQQLKNAGIGCPQYLQNREGRHLYCSEQVRAVVSKRIDGVTPRHMSVDLAADIGRHLALFHTSVRTLPYSNNAGLINPAATTVDAELASRLSGETLPKGIIHGDFHSGNVLVDPQNQDRVIAILDFEEAGENLYLVDLAVTLMAVGAHWESDTIEPQLMRAAKRGYETVRPLTEDEALCLPDAIRYAGKAWIGWFQANGYERYACQHQRRYDSFEELLGGELIL